MKNHEILEKNIGLLTLFMILAVSIGGLTQIVPLFFQDVVNEPVEGMKPYTALQLEGRDIYIREGCVGCHSQMVRPFRAHLYNPRNVVPESKMPSYPWLVEHSLDGKNTADKMVALRSVGVPYTEEDIAGAKDAVKGKSEMDALVAYLQVLGTALTNKR